MGLKTLTEFNDPLNLILGPVVRKEQPKVEEKPSETFKHRPGLSKDPKTGKMSFDPPYIHKDNPCVEVIDKILRGNISYLQINGLEVTFTSVCPEEDKKFLIGRSDIIAGTITVPSVSPTGLIDGSGWSMGNSPLK